MPEDKKEVVANNEQPAGVVTPPKKNNSALKIVLIVLGVIIVLGIIGSLLVGFAFSSLLKKATNGGNVSIKDNTVQLQGKDGTTASVGGNAKLPEGFPSDISLYPGAKLTMGSKGKDAYSVYLVTKDSIDKVTKYYKAELTKSGWTSEDESSLSLGNSETISYKKGNRDLLLIVNTANKTNETGISITVTTIADANQPASDSSAE